MKGLFLTFEGSDGCGKSTLANLVKKKLEEQGAKVILTREPGGTEISEQIRKILLNPENQTMDSRTEALLYAASRTQHVRERIIPMLNQGYIVLCDRFLSSSLAYQGYARELGIQNVSDINDFGIEGFRSDIEFFIDTPIEERNKRLKGRDGLDRMELESDNFKDKVDKYFKYSNISNGRIVLDGMKTPEELSDEVLGYIKLLGGNNLQLAKDKRL